VCGKFFFFFFFFLRGKKFVELGTAEDMRRGRK
jgi:hypothetical protein